MATLACLLYVMDLTVLHVAIPQITAELHPTGTQLLWIIDGYGFTVAGALVTMGMLGDRIGRRRLLMFGAAAFGAVSLVAAFSTSAEMLIAARMLLGIAGATIAPSTLSLIFHMFTDPRQRSLAVGVWIGAFSAGSAVGPVLGGLVLASHHWSTVFLLALPVMAALLVLGPVVLPETATPRPDGSTRSRPRCRSPRCSPSSTGSSRWPRTACRSARSALWQAAPSSGRRGCGASADRPSR